MRYQDRTTVARLREQCRRRGKKDCKNQSLGKMDERVSLEHEKTFALVNSATMVACTRLV